VSDETRQQRLSPRGGESGRDWHARLRAMSSQGLGEEMRAEHAERIRFADLAGALEDGGLTPNSVPRAVCVLLPEPSSGHECLFEWKQSFNHEGVGTAQPAHCSRAEIVRRLRVLADAIEWMA
jgi:hypothetical protein